MSLRFVLEDWVILKKIFTNINKIIDEIIVVCDEDGLNFSGIDRSHICYFEGIISKELFDDYSIDKGILMYIDLEDFVSVLKRGKSKDKLIFEANDEIFDFIYLNKDKRKFSLTQLDNVNDTNKPPNLNYGVSFECDYDIIENSLKDCDLYSDVLNIVCKDSKLMLTCEGTKGKYTNELDLDADIPGSFSSSYSVMWLLRIFDTKLGSDGIVINMGQDFPMLIEMGIDNVEMKYLLAPRLDNDI